MRRGSVVVRHGPGLIGSMVRTAVLAGMGSAGQRSPAPYRVNWDDEVILRVRQLTELAEAGILTGDEYHAGMRRLLQAEPGEAALQKL